MTVTSRRVAAARRAKTRLAQLFASCEWFLGVGIVPEGARGVSLRVDVAAGAWADSAELPEEFEGLPVEVVRIAGRFPR